MNPEHIYPLFLKHDGISTDTRNIRPGSIFFALKGDHFNGNDFAAEALKAGAAYAVVDDSCREKSERFILVDDVLKTLQQLASHHRKQFSIPVIAITGTNGKTTTKELFHFVLSRKYNTLATAGNLNNHIGVPVTLLNIKKETGIAIIEMGANHPGEIDFLCRMADPEFGLITNVGKAHLEGFGSFEGVVRTKTELYIYLREKNGTIFLNTDHALLEEKSAGITAVTYGTGSGTTVRGSVITADPFVTMKINAGEKEIQIRSQLYGSYNAENILAAACAGFHFGVDPEKIEEAINDYKPSNNRSQVVQTGRNLVILDAYNANPSSMELAVVGFAKARKKNSVLILGDMLELGADAGKEHAHILELVKASGIRQVYLVGPVFTQINTEIGWHCFADSELAKVWFGHHPVDDSSVLIKGSRGMKLESLLPFF